MGFSESRGYGCRKHPNHEQKQGVCPFCLREKLSSLSSASCRDVAKSRVAPSYSPSLSFSPADHYSTASSSNSASPYRNNNFHKRNGSGLMGIIGSSSLVKVRTTNGLKKSRSIAFVPRNFGEDNNDGEEIKNGKNKKKKGFWSKLLRLKGKHKDVLTHSTSMRFIIGRVN